MPVYVSWCAHDIFVSYGHVDNKRLVAGKKQDGWVTDLVSHLKDRLAQRLGRDDAFDLWIDWNLKGTDTVTPVIMKALEGSALLLIILSPGFLASIWCQAEFRQFVQRWKAAGLSGRIFVIERDEVDREKWPQELKDLRAFRFWENEDKTGPARIFGDPQQDPAEKEYWLRANEVVYELEEKLGWLAKIDPGDGGPQPVPPGPGDGTSKAVFVAQVTDDLDALRERLIAYLKQAGIAIRWTPVDGYESEKEFRNALKQELASSTLFVQLLGPIPGKQPRWSDLSYTALQMTEARAHGIPMLQWRSPELKLEELEPRQRSLIDGATIMAVGIEEFKEKVVASLHRETASAARAMGAGKSPNKATHVGDGLFVFIIADNEDRPVATAIAREVQRKQMGYLLAPLNMIRKSLKENLELSDAFIVVYENSPAGWAERQLVGIQKILVSLDDPPPSLAVYLGPPQGRRPLGFMLPGTQTIDCQAGFSVTALEHFLDTVKKRKPGA